MRFLYSFFDYNVFKYVCKEKYFSINYYLHLNFIGKE